MSIAKLVATFATRDHAHRIAGALQDLIEPAPDALTVFETAPDAWKIEAYYEHGADPAATNSGLADILGEPSPGFMIEEVPDLNWVALSQAALPPVQAGRFTIHGTHDQSRVARGPWSILIDAGEAFGTAHHATTFGCLRAIDRLTEVRAFCNVLDLGCGSGVLAIAAARSLPAARVIATDLDHRSVEVARENVALNGVAQRIKVLQAAGIDHAALRGQRFDLIVANILADPLIRLARTLSRSSAPCGRLVLSGLLIHQAPAVIAAYRAAGYHMADHTRYAGWSTLTLARRPGQPKERRS